MLSSSLLLLLLMLLISYCKYCYQWWWYNYTWSEFLIPTLADSHLLEFKWQQVPSGFLGSSQYCSWSQKCFSLDGLDLSLIFQLFQPPYQAFGNHSKCANYNWYHHYPHAPCFLSSLSRSKYLSLFLLSLIFTLWSDGTANSTIGQGLFFLLVITRLYVCISKSMTNE